MGAMDILRAGYYNMSNVPFWDVRIYKNRERIKRRVFKDIGQFSFSDKTTTPTSKFILPTDPREQFRNKMGKEVMLNVDNAFPMTDKVIKQNELGEIEYNYIRFNSQIVTPQQLQQFIEDDTLFDLLHFEEDFWQKYKGIITVGVICITAFFVVGMATGSI